MGHPPSPLSRPHSGDSSSSKGRDSQPRSSSKANKAGSHHAAGQNGHRETSAAAQKAAVTCRTTSDGSEDKENGLIGMPSNASTPRKRPRASDMRLDTRASLSPQTERINAVEKALLDHADKPPAKKRRKVTVHGRLTSLSPYCGHADTICTSSRGRSSSCVSQSKTAL